MKRTTLSRTLRSLIFSLAGIWLASSAMGQTPLTLLQEAFPGVDVANLWPRPMDYVPIAVSSARTWGNPNGVEVVFTVPVNPATATNAANYTVTPGIAVQKAVILPPSRMPTASCCTA